MIIDLVRLLLFTTIGLTFILISGHTGLNLPAEICMYFGFSSYLLHCSKHLLTIRIPTRSKFKHSKRSPLKMRQLQDDIVARRRASRMEQEPFKEEDECKKHLSSNV